jgi:peptidoglycan LD-endopeptidase CwlK
MNTNIDDLQSDVAARAHASMAALKVSGIPAAVTSTLRTEAVQMALFAQGRDALPAVNLLRSQAGMPPIGAVDNSYTVTNCDGVKYKSNHQGGRALDVVPLNAAGNPVWPDHMDPRWAQIASVMKANGFQWGGDWPRFPDFPHYEMT